jgi:hypothetical protein
MPGANFAPGIFAAIAPQSPGFIARSSSGKAEL